MPSGTAVDGDRRRTRARARLRRAAAPAAIRRGGRSPSAAAPAPAAAAPAPAYRRPPGSPPRRPRRRRRDARPGPRSQILSPFVRQLAEERGLDLSHGRRHGRGRTDHEGGRDGGVAAARPQAAATVTPTRPSARRPLPWRCAPSMPAAGEEVVPMSHIRKAIATHMVASLQQTARAWNMVEVNVEHVVRTPRAREGEFRRTRRDEA